MFCQSLALGLLGSRVAYALKEPYTLVYSYNKTSKMFLINIDHESLDNEEFVDLLGSFRPDQTQTGLYSHRRWLEA